ncbi:hypothetical protein HUJ04_004064 [Dendroctonus ponderosae]|nr:hypothetical protein HUJ04_004064 [Dendroctonus ponderosae]
MERHSGGGTLPHLRGRPVSGLEAAHANEYFEPFLNATTLKNILGYHRFAEIMVKNSSPVIDLLLHLTLRFFLLLRFFAASASPLFERLNELFLFLLSVSLE